MAEPPAASSSEEGAKENPILREDPGTWPTPIGHFPALAQGELTDVVGVDGGDHECAKLLFPEPYDALLIHEGLLREPFQTLLDCVTQAGAQTKPHHPGVLHQRWTASSPNAPTYQSPFDSALGFVPLLFVPLAMGPMGLPVFGQVFPGMP